MQDIQAAKDLVLACQEALEAAPADAAADTLARFTAPDYLWRGMHPFDRITGAEAVGSRFWDGLRGSLTHIQRRMDVFFAGANSLDGGASVWVVSMGHLMGLFDAPWLGIRPSGRLTMLRYCDFHRVEGGKIKETAAFFDIPHLMMQAGQNPFPPQTAAHLVQPGPRPHDGLLTGPQDPGAGDKTLAVINAMINDLGTWKSGLPLEEELAQTWHDDMLWWGPAGIGASYTIARYARQHSGPFRAGFTERSRTRHLARLAEGHYGGFFGWPNFTAIPTGGFMGLPASTTAGEFRVIDIYRRRGDKLAENWVFIDLLHYLKTQGLDVLARNGTV
ncbi:nuclear transport factor 2 family protein [Alterinioella nitratireducens]|uniref:nuclear transport factor 2 family protein n=1 Tax=Alterinioella nitratireducens TaxID=2735915 RepID=UPI001555ECDD|nr:nuclear transport factor 2 family protein [Alterinioella nitratireducens]NPD17933.1 SnoaL-like domain-containing protein [Alterinioella nitratireducens]